MKKITTKKEKTTAIIANYPHLVNQWDYNKNTDIDINLKSANSKDNAWWKCKKCGYEWKAQIVTRKLSKGLCPCCENRTVVVKGITDLFTLVPDLQQDYHYIMNKDINLYKLSASSHSSIWWKCHECGHEWQGSPSTRLQVKGDSYRIRNCPACVGNARSKSYADEYPELINRFVESMNRCKLADLKGADLHHSFWWHCDICGEDFKAVLGALIRSKDTQNKGCSFCAGKKVTREKSFAYLHPEVMDEYAPSNTIDPYNVTEHSTKPAIWVCRNNNEHKWEASFHSRAKGEGGCKICRSWNYSKMLFEEHPEFEQYYDKEKNIRPFNSYSNMSNENVSWNCESGHSFQWSILNFSRLGRFECPICVNKMFVSGENDLESQDTDLANEFHVEKNGIGPDMIAFTDSNEEIWWKCGEGHEFQRSVWYRVNRVRACPICNRTVVAKGINDSQTAYPDIIKIWDYERNERKPDEISDRNNMKFAFKCDHGHHYETYLGTVVANNFDCMVCSEKIVQECVNSLIDTHPDLAKEFSPNEERKPNEFSKNFAYTIKWKCPTCGGEYSYPINEREVGDESCPYCHKDRVLAGFNSLIDTHWDLAREFSPSNERGPETYHKSNKSWVSWLCPTCSGEYSYPINEREVGDESCPYCHKNRALAGFNSLIDTHSNLAKEFSPSNERGPETYHKECTYRAAWLCPTCGGEYSYPINEREVGDESCPYCHKNRALAGFNSLIDTHSDLVKEFSPSNERGPETYHKECTYRAAWLCPTCGGEYSYPINEREVGDDACPFCRGTKALPGVYSFELNHPDLMEEWDRINNYLLCDPDAILDTYSKNVWWICKDCKKRYLMSPKKRIYYQKRNMKACTTCKGLRRKKKYFF